MTTPAGTPTPYEDTDIGCVIGTGIGGIATIEDQHIVLRERGEAAMSPLCVPQMMPNAAAGAVAMRHGLRGECYGTVSACAAGAQAVGAGLRMVERGDVSACVVGGAEAGVTPLAIAAFGKMGATSKSGVSRPFDRRRDGFVIAEGAGILVLENVEAAAERGATVLGRITGYGATADAHHVTAPDPDGDGAARAIEAALRDADVEPGAVEYVNAHGTSTPLNDRSETEAIKRVFGERSRSIPVSSLKSSIGHLLGAAGAVEAVATVLALRDGVAPPTLNYEEPDDGLDLDYVPGESAHRAQRARPGRDLELVRLRRTQRRAQHGGARMTVAAAPRTRSDSAREERLPPLERLEALCDPGSFRPALGRRLAARR